MTYGIEAFDSFEGKWKKKSPYSITKHSFGSKAEANKEMSAYNNFRICFDHGIGKSSENKGMDEVKLSAAILERGNSIKEPPERGQMFYRKRIAPLVERFY